MATRMGILSYGVILALTVLTGLLPTLTNGNVIDQRVLQRELGENSPEMMSMNDKDEFRELEEPAVNDYAIKTKVCISSNLINVSLLTLTRLKISINSLTVLYYL